MSAARPSSVRSFKLITNLGLTTVFCEIDTQIVTGEATFILEYMRGSEGGWFSLISDQGNMVQSTDL